MQREIYKTIVISTAHITENDSLILESIQDKPWISRLAVDKFDYGYYVSGTISDLGEPLGFSEALLNLLSLTTKEDCLYLKIDRDGPIYNDLPIFEW